MREYRHFRIRIDREDSDTYRVSASGSTGEAGERFELPFSELELENMILRLGRPRRNVRRVDTSDVVLMKRVGTGLFDALFPARVRDLYRDSAADARGEGKGLRLTLSLGRVPELMGLPWEYLYDDPDFVSISTWTPVVRYLDLPRARRPLPVELPLRILAMVSAPSDAVALDVAHERTQLEQALARLIADDAVEITWLEGGTLRALQRALRKTEFHVFHFIGHGGYDVQADDGILLLEDERGSGRRVSGLQLGTILADHRSLRLAVLNACEGARSTGDDPFASVASSLVQREIPAVIAMQFEISDAAAIIFASEFYAAIADGYPVDSALAEARKAIFADHNEVEWATPVLFMRVADGRVFAVENRALAEGPQAHEPARTQPESKALTTPDDAQIAEEPRHAVEDLEQSPQLLARGPRRKRLRRGRQIPAILVRAVREHMLLSLVAILVPLVAVAAFLTYQLSPETPPKVPDVRACSSVFCAQELLAQTGLELGRVVQFPTSLRAPGSIVNASPAVGTEVQRGTAIDLRVAISGTVRKVPSVIGSTANEAERILRAAGFLLGTANLHGADAETGVILGQDPGAGSSHYTGSPVDVVIGDRS